MAIPRGMALDLEFINFAIPCATVPIHVKRAYPSSIVVQIVGHVILPDDAPRVGTEPGGKEVGQRVRIRVA